MRLEVGVLCVFLCAFIIMPGFINSNTCTGDLFMFLAEDRILIIKKTIVNNRPPASALLTP